MQFTSGVPGVSFRQEPHQGQREVFQALERGDSFLNIQLPTGYGKTFTAAGCYAIQQRRLGLNRLLLIFPTDAQLNQFVDDSKSDRSDLWLANVEGPLTVNDVSFFGAECIKAHRQNRVQVFAITVQALIQARGDDNVRMLMQTGKWMVVVDEYHHYGLDKAWGRSVRSLPCQFLLAMSATPSRPNDDSAFGKPHVMVSYRNAVKEGVVKPLVGHAYHYRVETIDHEGNVQSFTTAELADQAGDSPDAIEHFMIKRQMRWSPKYISPLVHNPIERAMDTRLRTGHRAQALLGAMCVSHAELVCDQVRTMYPDLAVDWVGTGMNGRSRPDNRKILERFCPTKNAAGVREPSLDVLVHVDIAGEGLDATLVTEIVHLNGAARNNSNDQENGRAARRLIAPDGTVMTGHINFDASSEYAKFVGPAIMDAMDGLDAPQSLPDDPPEPSSQDDEYWPLPDEPSILICDVELDHIDSGDPGVVRMGAVLQQMGVRDFEMADFTDASSPRHAETIAKAIAAYRAMRRHEAEDMNAKSAVSQWKDHVNVALTKVVGLIVKRRKEWYQRVGMGDEVTPADIGEIKRRINVRKKRALGEIAPDVALLRQHYQWIRNLEGAILRNDCPTWLS